MSKIGTCEDCGRKTDISNRNICIECSIKRVKNAVYQMHEREGEVYERWKQSTAHKRKKKHHKGK